MSNTAASPGNRPLEQLKVAELRDELKKRGLSLKGVKKELFERLEEAVKKEEQEVAHGEHEATLEGAHKSSTSDEIADVEGEEEVLDESKSETTKSLDTATACQDQNISSMDAPLPTTEESTPLSQETHALPVVSAPDGDPGSNEEMKQLSVASVAKMESNDEDPGSHEEREQLGVASVAKVESNDEDPGSNEEREQLSIAIVAKVESNDDRVSVDKAVCGNGDVMLSPVNTVNVADVSEPCKDTSGVEHVKLENEDEKPDIVMSEFADSKRMSNVLPDSGIAIDVVENIVSDAVAPSAENGDIILAADNSVRSNDAGGNVCSGYDLDLKVDNVSVPFPDVNLKQDKVSIPATNPDIEADNKSSMQLDSGESVEIPRGEVLTKSLIISSSQSTVSQRVVEPDAELKSEVDGHTVDERDLIINEVKSDVIINEVKFDVKSEEAVKQEIVSEDNLEETTVKIEPMEIETHIEERQEAIYEVKRESENDREDHMQVENPLGESQLKEVKSERDNSQKSRGEERANRVTDEWRTDKKDGYNLRTVEDDTQAHINSKRKDNETDVKQEPAKRMRRWNSGKEVVIDAPKPLTTDTMKDIMLPESAEGLSAIAQRLTPKTVATSRALPAKVKVEPEPINNTRTVPPSTQTSSNSLKVERFVRPFTLKAVKDLLAEFGQCVDFWMDQIKTHCFITYSSVNEAVAARNGLYGRQWPPSVGNCLVADFVDANEVKIRSEGLAEKVQVAPMAAPMRASNSTQGPPSRVGQTVSLVRSDPNILPSPRFSRDIQPPPAPKKDPEPAVVTLEDLFFKTKAKPHIYYLPLTDEQVAEKIKKKQAAR